MDLRHLLHRLIVIEVVLVLVYLGAEMIGERFLPQSLRAWLDHETNYADGIDIIMMILALPVLAAMVVSWVGLWQLWGWARWVYLLSLSGGLMLEALGGPWVYTGPGAALGTAQSVITGMILALVFLTPLSEEFERPRAAAAGGGFEVGMAGRTRDGES